MHRTYSGCPCRRRHYRSRLLLVVLLSWITASGSLADSRVPESPPSIIEIPLRLSLEPLVNAAEDLLPRQAGHWRGWKDWHGIKSQYRAWRGPLKITASGDVLTVQAHIRYWIRARKKLLGTFSLQGSCGIDEPPRQALIGMQLRLHWTPDWTLRPQFRLLPTRFLDRCEMTIADIDVTPLVGREFRHQMQDSLRVALRRIAPGMNAIRPEAQRIWSRLQEPVELGQDHWLLLRPSGVALSRMQGRGAYIDTRLVLVLRPEVVSGAGPAVEPAPLPPPGQLHARPEGLYLNIGIRLDLAALDRQVGAALAERSFEIGGRRTGIGKFELFGSGQDVRARLQLTGELAGSALLRARLAFDAASGSLQLQDLAFDYDAKDPVTGLLADAFREPVRQALENAANRALAQQLERFGERLFAGLQRIAPAGVSLDTSAVQLRALRIDIGEDVIRLDGSATGSVRLVLH